MNKRSVIALLKPYWASSDRRVGIPLAACVLLAAFFNTWMLVRYNHWYGSFFSALQKLDATAFWSLWWPQHRSTQSPAATVCWKQLFSPFYTRAKTPVASELASPVQRLSGPHSP